MGTLAFDRERVGWLARRLAEALDALGRVPADPVTVEATNVARVIRHQLGPWHPRLMALAACGVLEGYRPTGPDPTELFDAHLLVLAADRGWSLTTDPGVAPVDWQRWSGALGRQLATGDLDALLRDDGIERLRAQLRAIAGSPAACDELVSELGVIGLVRLVDALGARWRAESDAAQRFAHRDPGPSTRPPGATAAECVRLLGAALAGRPFTTLAVVALAEPDGVPELVAGAGLSGPVLGLAAAVALGRWARRDTPWWLERRQLPATLPDRLGPMLAGDPVAAGLLIDRLVAEGLLGLLLFGGHDDDAGLRVLAAATGPDGTDERSAGRRLLPVLAWLRTEPLWSAELMTATTSDSDLVRRWEHIRAGLGTLVAPWQLHLSGLAARWDARPEHTIADLVWVADHPRSAAGLAAGLAPAVVRATADLPTDARSRRALVDDVATGIGASAEVLRDAETDEWDERRSRIRTVTALADRIPVVSHPVAKAAKSAGLELLGDWIAGDRDAVAARAIESEQARLGELAEVLASAIWVDALRTGRVDASTPAVSPELALELQHARDAVANPAGRGDALAARAAD